MAAVVRFDTKVPSSSGADFDEMPDGPNWIFIGIGVGAASFIAYYLYMKWKARQL